MAFSCKVLVYFENDTLIIRIIIVILDGFTYFMKIMKKIRNRISISFSKKINFHEIKIIIIIILIIIILLLLLFIFTPKGMKYKFRGCGRSLQKSKTAS